jgi:hypothetical protein
LFNSIVRFRPVTYKAFQQKFKQAEDMATQILLPGAHSNRPGEIGEQLPPWMIIFHFFLIEKKSGVEVGSTRATAYSDTNNAKYYFT